MKKIIFFIGILTGMATFAQEIELELFATGLSNTVNIQNAGDSRLFVLDRAGIIRSIDASGEVNSTFFLDIRDRVSNAQDERGLLGLAFHPNYASNGYFYVNYVNNDMQSIVSRFNVDADDLNRADPDSEYILMSIPQPYANHNGGEMVFDNVGMLLMGFGDGGSGGDPQNRAQNLNSFLGKILRIDVDNPSNGKNYRIPADNPYVDSSTALPEIWAYGLRNPWRFSIDKTTNELWIADVGQANVEEINVVSASTGGINYGWRCYEGSQPYNTKDCPDVNTINFPISEYTHDNDGLFKCSITGGFRYRGTLQSSLTGIYFFADYCSAEIGMLTLQDGDWTMRFSEPFNGKNWTTFGEDVNGELYIGDISSGNIYKIKEQTLGTDHNSLSQLAFYPNPVTHEFTIKSGKTFVQNLQISIYNIHGQQIKAPITVEGNSSKVATGNLDSGLYFMEVKTEDGQKLIRKFIKN